MRRKRRTFVTTALAIFVVALLSLLPILSVPRTYAAEPTGHASDFVATASQCSIMLTWTDAGGSDLPDGYLVLANKTGTFTDPVDGTSYPDDLDLSDGSGAFNVMYSSSYGDERAWWTGLDGNTTYYF